MNIFLDCYFPSAAFDLVLLMPAAIKATALCDACAFKAILYNLKVVGATV
jgi:hypothetical protein